MYKASMECMVDFAHRLIHYFDSKGKDMADDQAAATEENTPKPNEQQDETTEEQPTGI